MAQTVGIDIEHNVKGAPIFARIDLKKYGSELHDFFSTKGIEVEESPYNPEFIAKIKRSEQQIRDGKCKTVRNTEELRALLDSL
jgi:hypothetical protein